MRRNYRRYIFPPTLLGVRSDDDVVVIDHEPTRFIPHRGRAQGDDTDGRQKQQRHHRLRGVRSDDAGYHQSHSGGRD